MIPYKSVYACLASGHQQLIVRVFTLLALIA